MKKNKKIALIQFNLEKEDLENVVLNQAASVDPNLLLPWDCPRQFQKTWIFLLICIWIVMQNNSRVKLKNTMDKLYIGIFYVSFLVSIPIFFVNIDSVSGTKLMPVFWYLMTVCLFVAPISMNSQIVINTPYLENSSIE